MRDILLNKGTFIWLLLIFLTGMSWLMADNYQFGGAQSTAWLSAGLILVAFFKVRLVIMYFMEVGTAPILLRAVFEIWIVGVCLIVIGLYLFAHQIQDFL